MPRGMAPMKVAKFILSQIASQVLDCSRTRRVILVLVMRAHYGRTQVFMSVHCCFVGHALLLLFVGTLKHIQNEILICYAI